MTASAAIAASAATYVIGDGISSGVWSLLGSAIGALAAYSIARHQQKAQSERERIKSATDSASSHMANVAFDKYVEFCERYKDEAGEGVLILIQHGPTPEIISEARKLSDIRYSYTLWIPSEVDTRLQEFEKIWLTIGAFSRFEDATKTSIDEATRRQHVSMVYKEFAKVMGLKEWEGEAVTNEFTVASIVAGLREVLGTEKMSKLRRRVLDRAMADLD
ncbi:MULTISPECIES: hypothetical protein [Paraburkholderia]|uniref:hypothetical protein n=1 Tax=Paraburkholderia TaxID=1822464 RepID=UPI00225B6B1A|nr:MULTISPECIES: hypothetical protein [Paraburkholderia]MCX4170690.1 hypothetical protein [Paraburkholderia madseniana]MDQ6458702.1 hypothetical protein [Paraburkholderia madseniana]